MLLRACTCFQRRDEITGHVMEKSILAAISRRATQPQVGAMDAAPETKALDCTTREGGN
jgi:hypothetical protein